MKKTLKDKLRELCHENFPGMVQIVYDNGQTGPLGEVTMACMQEYCRFEQTCRQEAPPEQPWYRKENSE